MGAWGTGPFDNDGAGDLLASVRNGDFEFEEWVPEDDYLEIDSGQGAIAMAQLVVSAREGGPVPDVDDLAPFTAQLTPERIASIRALVERAIASGETSELYELWAETDDFDEWITQARDLIAALN